MHSIQQKNLLLDSQALVHYDHTLPPFPSRDASSYCAGDVLSHKISGQFRPVAFASYTLTSARHNYSQLETEALSIIFGLKRFCQYLPDNLNRSWNTADSFSTTSACSCSCCSSTSKVGTYPGFVQLQH